MHTRKIWQSISGVFPVLILAAPASWGQTLPSIGVSPGGEAAVSEVEHRCPTFSWGGDAETSSWELVVYRLADDDLMAGPQIEDPRPILTVQLPGSARAWTPALGQCLEPGGRYAWSVRGFGKETDDSWSEPRLFQVTAAPTMAEVRDAMAVLSAYLGTESLEIRTDLGLGEVTDTPIPITEVPPPAAAPEEIAASLGGNAAVRGVQTAGSGDASGLIGETASAEGAGGVFGNTAGGPDVVLDGSNDTATDTLISQGGLDRSSDSPETFDFGNSGSGEMTVTVDGVEVVTTATDADTLYTAGNQLSLNANQFHVVEGSGSGLDSDTLDGLDSTSFVLTGADNWVNVTGDTMTGTLTLNPGAGNAITTGASIDIGAGSVRKSGTLFLHNTGSFNVGVGLQALESNTTAFGGTAVGQAALRYNTTGLYNTGVGTEALMLNVEGDHNTGLGRGALKVSTASFNTAVGSGAMRTNTTGFGNTAVGWRAMFDNIDGRHNVAIGDQSLIHNFQSDGSVAIGSQALLNNLLSRNTAVGYRAMKENTNGNGNAAFGAEALMSNILGFQSTAVGSEALRDNTSSLENTAVGSRAMKMATSGDSNTALGSRALHDNLTGSFNLALGIGAGESVVGSSNILLNHTGDASFNNILQIGGGTGTIPTFLDEAYIHGITGRSSTGGSTVLINTIGKLGTIASSRRFKEQISGVDQFSDDLLALRPVQFRYTEEHAGTDSPPLEFGLIAEEVAEVFPDLVIYDEGGNPFTVRYHLLAPLLLNEIQRQQEINATLTRRLEILEGRSAEVR